MTARAKVVYVHRISPSEKDVAGPFPLPAHALESATSARAWLHKHTGDNPRLTDARRYEKNGWIFFPLDRCGNWHSIAVVPIKGE